MRTAFRLAAFLLACSLLLSYYGAGTSGLLGGPSATTVHPSVTSCADNVTITAYANPYAFSPSAVGPLCMSATLVVVNTGTTQHTFTLSNQVNWTDPSTTDPSPFSWPNLFYDQYLNGTGSAGSTLYVHLTFHVAGVYQFICRPHYALGMMGKLYVETDLPTVSTPPTFEPFWYIVMVITGLAVLTVVLGLVYGKRGAHPDTLDRSAPITSRPEYFNDSRPEPLDSAEPTLRDGGGH